MVACKSTFDAVGVDTTGVLAVLLSPCSETAALVDIEACGGGRTTPFAAAAWACCIARCRCCCLCMCSSNPFTYARYKPTM